MDRNRCEFAGRITRDHELRYTPKGTAVLEGGMAINRRWKDGNGQKQEAVTFINFKAFGSTAENLSQYTGKGSPIFLETRFELEQWEDKQSGEKKSRPVFIVEAFHFMESAKQQAERGEQRGGGGGHGGGGSQGNTRPQQQPARGGQGGFTDYDDDGDDIPF